MIDKIQKRIKVFEKEIEQAISTFEKDTNMRVMTVSRKDKKIEVGCFIDMDNVNI